MKRVGVIVETLPQERESIQHVYTHTHKTQIQLTYDQSGALGNF